MRIKLHCCAVCDEAKEEDFAIYDKELNDFFCRDCFNAIWEEREPWQEEC